MLGAALDITARRAAVEALHEAARRKDEFLAMLAHELRNPLAPIRNAVETLQLTHDPDTVTQLSSTIRRQVQHLARLVDDLLDVSRITQGKITLRLGRVDLASAVQSAVEAVRPLVAERQHQLVVTPPRESLTLRADPTRLAQVIGNLLNNAAKYTAPGGRIDIGWQRDGDMAELTVRDNGIGIPREILEQVFDLFVQENRTIDRSQGGLGIGLALVKSLVQMHGGTVAAHSEGSGFGSCFTLRLPLAAADTPAPPPAAPASDVAPAAQHLRVLVVDDNVDAAETLALVLRLQGHEAHVETSARGALAAAPQFKPDAVFLDIGLPELDGYAVARALRADATTAGALLVAVTGYGTDRDRERARAEGFDEHLTKPADLAKINALLATPRSTAA
jgi:CheY-like chemotaxis protein/two-component sensor histidine kinase